MNTDDLEFLLPVPKFAKILGITQSCVRKWIREKRVTAFGAFFDSTLDRYSYMALYMGLLVYYAVAERTSYVILSAVATAGSVMVSYSRARAESIIPSCKVGFMERPERLVLLIMGGVFNRMAQVLWVIATISTITVVHRVVYTWQELRAGRSLPAASATQRACWRTRARRSRRTRRHSRGSRAWSSSSSAPMGDG